jgi:hypothetical protein
MIPALLAAPIVQGVLGQVMNLLSPTPNTPPATATTTTSFSPYLNRAAGMAQTSLTPSASTSPSGIMRADEWNQMQPADMKTWAQSLTGRHVDVTDAAGRTISGVVSGTQQMGNTFGLNIGGHLVSLSQLKQVTWSPATA